jgi:hypothetical protein
MPIGVRDIILAVEALSKWLKDIPPSVGFSVVRYGNKPSPKDHLRIINTGPATIHGFSCTLHTGKTDSGTPIRRVFRRSQDVFGTQVEFDIELTDTGIYLRPDSPIYVPLSELTGFNLSSDMFISFKYQLADGTLQKSKPQNISRVTAKSVSK